MSYESIAELVHELVKNPKSIRSSEIHSAGQKSNEIAIIQSVFSEFEVSRDVVALGTLPLGFWV